MQIEMRASDASPWIKVCGFTVAEEACAAAAVGVNAVGFVFAKSARQVTPPQAARITQQLPKQVVKVGVFVNETPFEVLQTVDAAGLDAVQLHGDETPAMVEQLINANITVIKCIRATAADIWDKLSDYRSAGVKYFLFDAWSPGAFGGTGQTCDWSMAAQAATRNQIILAGGLRPDNVFEAVQQTRPWGLDVSSGVESSPGRKDIQKIQLFISRASLVTKETNHF